MHPTDNWTREDAVFKNAGCASAASAVRDCSVFCPTAGRPSVATVWSRTIWSACQDLSYATGMSAAICVRTSEYVELVVELKTSSYGGAQPTCSCPKLRPVIFSQNWHATFVMQHLKHRMRKRICAWTWHAWERTDLLPSWQDVYQYLSEKTTA